ncbi:MAG: RNA polymerase sigma factor [Gemmataceae bacterium]
MAESTLRRAIQHLIVGLHKAEGTDDAALLARFAAWRDEAAFELLVFRHGPMVRGVCRRLLRHEQDAEDAFQATFLALARKAGSVRGALGGWLYRVACHAALKARARSAKRQAATLIDDVATADESADVRELRTVLDEEVLRLPERFRLPVVLCYLQGRSNSEAAAEIGCPRGTVDSRLSEARRRLRGRLAKRGLAPAAAGVALEELLVPSAELSAAAVRPVVRAAVAFASHHPASAAAIPASAAALAQGVLHVMYLNQIKWAAGVLLVLCTLGTGGIATFRANADDPPKKDAKAPEAKKGAPPDAVADAKIVTRLSTAREIRAKLQMPVTIDKPIDNLPLREALEFFGEKYKVSIRIDPVPFLRINPYALPFKLYEQEVRIDSAKGLTLGEVLRGIIAPLRVEQNQEVGGGPIENMRLTFLARNNQVAIVPAFQTPYGRTPDSEPFIEPQLLEEQVLGDWVTVDVQDQPLADVLRDLADQTGANVVLDVRQKEKGKTPVTLTLQQVRLFKALQVLAEMADLKPVPLHNVYFVTDPKNADKLEKAERPTSDPPPQMLVPGTGFGGGNGALGAVGGGGGMLGVTGGGPTPPKP